MCKGFNCKIILYDEILMGCDSLYVVYFKFKEIWDYYNEFKFLIEWLEDLVFNYKDFDFIFIGGELSLYFNNFILLSVLGYFYYKKIFLFVESNGFIFFEFSFILKELYFILSVKFFFFLEEESKWINFKVL